MAYNLYPAVDEQYSFPPEVRRALSVSLELRNTVVPMTEALRNNLLPSELWDGRVIVNTTIDRLERYDETTAQWYILAETEGAEVQYVNIAGDTMQGQLGLLVPTALDKAARFSDGIPRFPDQTSRDAAYAALGGPTVGMVCYVGNRFETYITGDIWVILAKPQYSFRARLTANTAALPSGFTHLTTTDVFYNNPGGELEFVGGFLQCNVSGYYMVGGNLNLQAAPGQASGFVDIYTAGAWSNSTDFRCIDLGMIDPPASYVTHSGSGIVDIFAGEMLSLSYYGPASGAIARKNSTLWAYGPI